MSFDLNQAIRGKVWKFGDSIDTDCINPFYRYGDNAELLRQHTMESARPEFAGQVRPGDLVVGGRNFGCGSARPPHVLFEVGVAAVLAESFATLFLRNCVSVGDFVLAVPGISQLVEDGQTLEVDYRAGFVKNSATGQTLRFKAYPPMLEQMFLAGGIRAYTKARYDAESAAG